MSVANATGTLCGAKTARSHRKLDFDRKICYNYLVKTREEQEEKTILRSYKNKKPMKQEVKLSRRNLLRRLDNKEQSILARVWSLFWPSVITLLYYGMCAAPDSSTLLNLSSSVYIIEKYL